MTVAVVCRGWLLGTAPVFPVTDPCTPGPPPFGLSLIPGLTGGLLAIAATGLVYLPRTRSRSCRSTGCGGPRSAARSSASAACSNRARSASATTSSTELLTGRAGLAPIVGILSSRP